MRKEDIWYKKIGLKENPFNIKPAFFSDEIFGYDKDIDSIVEAMEDGNMWFLEGHFGTGKTTMIKYFINEFRGKKRVIYLSLNRKDRTVNFDKVLKGASKGLKKLFNMRAKNTILILDEVEGINTKDCEQIIDKFDEGFFSSVLFVGNSYENTNLTKEIREYIGKNITTLKAITEEDAVDIVQSRLETIDEELISGSLIKKVFNKSNKNVRLFLENMEEVCKDAIDNDQENVVESNLDAIKKPATS